MYILSNIFLILLFIYFTSADDICDEFFFTNAVNNKCAYKINGGYRLNICDKDQYCPFDLNTLKNTGVISCVNKTQKQLKSFPGGSCKSSEDCNKNFPCINSVCSGKSTGQDCSEHADCLFSDGCINNKCTKLKTSGETCSSDYECELDNGCYNNICIPYFSLSDETNVSNAIQGEKFCESGLSLSDNVCRWYNDNSSYSPSFCSTSCEYKYSTSFGEIKIIKDKSKCECTFSEYTSKNCKISNGNRIFKEYLAAKKKLLKEEKNLCNTIERDNDGLCVEKYKRNDYKFRLLAQQYTNNKIMKENYHKLYSSKEELFNVLFPEYNTNIIIPSANCPIFSCDSTSVSKNTHYGCAQSTVLSSGDFGVLLVPDSCQSNEACSFNIDNVFQLGTTYFNCKNTTNYGKRYPGEDCTVDSDCMDIQSSKIKCVSKKCSGRFQGFSCTNTLQCNAGLSCKLNNEFFKTCQLQSKENETCSDDYDCSNNLLCHKGKCVKVYSLTEGVAVSNPKLCEYGEISLGTCSKIIYDNTKTGFIPCNYNDACKYKYTDNKIFTKPCECGYNSKGQGYCPIDHYTNVEKWKKLIKYKQELLNNDCHSMNRENCYKNADKLDYLNSLYIQTTQAHLYFDSVDCAVDLIVGLKSNFRIYIIIAIALGSIILSIAIIILLIKCCKKCKKKKENTESEFFLEAGRSSEITCTICFANPKHKKINCSSPIEHFLCKDCYKKLIVTDKIRFCPFCRNPIRY